VPDDIDIQEGDDQKVAITAKDLRALREIAKAHQELQQTAAAAQRELAFAKAKIDLADPKMSYFVKGYEGELDPEKIREAAREAGFLAPEQTGVSREESAGHKTLSNASAGAGDAADQDLLAAINAAKSPEEVMRIMVAAGSQTSWNRPGDS
jgi:hypothetical protein